MAGQAYNHGVKTSTVESAVCALETLGRLELLLEVGLLLDGAMGEGGTVVETLECGIGRGQSRGQSKETARLRHCVSRAKAND